MHHPTPLTWSPRWTVLDRDGVVVVSAGADRELSVQGAGPRLVATIERWQRGPISTTDPEERLLLDRLVDAGVVVPPTPATVALTGAVAEIERVRPHLEPHVTLGDEEGADLAVHFRGHGGWGATPDRPHVAVDALYHHTFVLGPHVIPGRSACTGCLDARVARRWPDRALPENPGATRWGALLAQLLVVQLELVRAGVSPLVNATVAWDLESGTADRQTLLKLPGCPTCSSGPVSGRLHPTWIDAA